MRNLKLYNSDGRLLSVSGVKNKSIRKLNKKDLWVV